jgi:hypothetical protein
MTDKIYPEIHIEESDKHFIICTNVRVSTEKGERFLQPVSQSFFRGTKEAQSVKDWKHAAMRGFLTDCHKASVIPVQEDRKNVVLVGVCGPDTRCYKIDPDKRTELERLSE